MKGRISQRIRRAQLHQPRADVRPLPRKGTIAVGADADIAIWDPERKVTIRQEILHHGSDYTPYEGLEVTGWPVTTIVRGETVVRDGTLVGPRSADATSPASALPMPRPPGPAGHRPRAKQSRLLQANAVRLPPTSGQSGTYRCVPGAVVSVRHQSAADRNSCWRPGSCIGRLSYRPRRAPGQSDCRSVAAVEFREPARRACR